MGTKPNKMLGGGGGGGVTCNGQQSLRAADIGINSSSVGHLLPNLGVLTVSSIMIWIVITIKQLRSFCCGRSM